MHINLNRIQFIYDILLLLLMSFLNIKREVQLSTTSIL